ncbi:MAG: PQQ-like beta-propeller repeat protein [Labilithrix sp.]|nr:PQQ-like beta-propeller repeat protein [Labilithrix sp.]MBX3221028.1 PQQ-like beta-propeller repeat protein [Labilithrix sp.]
MTWTPEAAPSAGGLPSPPRSGTRARPNEVLDLFIHGANVTARVAERHASCVLRDLASALTELIPSSRGKRIVRFYDDAWELCVERVGSSATLSVYRAGSEPTVLVYDRPVVFSEMCASVVDAIDATLARSPDDARGPVARELAEIRGALAGSTVDRDADDDDATDAPLVLVDLERDAPISFAAEFAMRAGAAEGTAAETGVERADLHALLVRGRMRAEVRGRSVELGEAYPFLFAERLLDLSRRALDAWERGQPFFTRMDAGGVMLGLRSNADEELPRAALTLGPSRGDGHRSALSLVPPSDGGSSLLRADARRGGISTAESATRRGTATFPELSLFDVVESALAFGRALVRAIVRRDRAQGTNLRLAAFRRDLRATGDALREVRRQDSRINPAPESYRAFAESRRARPAEEGAPLSSAARLRYTQRWQALVPGIDLRATFLCGDRLIIGSAAETFCLERTTGELLWRKSTPRAASVVTPAGVARIGSDGAIALHDFATGDVTLRAWIAPRVSGPSAGAVVSSAGLPRLLIVTEGERHLVAIDLTSGEARWRYLWSSGCRSGALRLKRAGKLLYVASGDSALTAVDVQTGAVVWRMRDRLRFVAAPTVDHEALFAIAGGSSSAAALHAVDPFSGESAWTARLLSTPNSVEGPPLLAASSVCVAVRARRGLRLAGFHRETGEQLFETETPVAPVGTSWLAVDDLLVGNTPTGELVGVDASTGAIRYRHTFGRTVESDVPRRLEPVLRSGALFVPHVDVHVFRPSDGAHLAQIGPCDAIPDLLRVDERCDVYVAEESGHMAAFGVGPRLSLVK